MNLRVMAAVELQVNATRYAQHSAFKSVYGKSQSVIGDKLFSSRSTVFKLVQGLRDSKTNDLNCYEGHSTPNGVRYLRLGHDPSQNFIKICQVVTIFKI